MRCRQCELEWVTELTCWLCGREGIVGRDESTQSVANSYSCKFPAIVTVDAIGIVRGGVA